MEKNFLRRFKNYADGVDAGLKGNEIVRRLVRGVFWSLSGNVGARIFSIVSTIVVARILGKENYGQLGMVLSTITMFSIFAGLGLGSTANKYVAEFRTREPRRAERIITLTNQIGFAVSFIVAFMILALAPWLARVVLHQESLQSVLRIGALLLLISTLRSVLTGPLAGFEAFKKIAKINIVEGLSTPIFAIPLVYLYSLQGAITSMIVTSSIAYWLSRRAIRQQCERYGLKYGSLNFGAFTEWRILVKFALPSVLSGLLVPPVIWVTNSCSCIDISDNSIGQYAVQRRSRQFEPT
jgi:O-antigen/teichoic acid export membrane protein